MGFEEEVMTHAHLTQVGKSFLHRGERRQPGHCRERDK